MITTAQNAAEELGVPHQRLRHYMKRGKVSYQRAGGVYILDPDVAQREMEEAGYYENLAVHQERLAHAAARRQAG